MYLTHNQHKDYYETVEQYLDNPWMKDLDIDEETRLRMIDSDEVWELQWYPDTPVGFYKVVGASFLEVMHKASNVEKQ